MSTSTSSAPSVILQALSLGLVVGVITSLMQVSFAAMIFSGELSDYAIRGAGLTLFGGFVFALVVGLKSSHKSMVAFPQDGPAALLAAIAVTTSAEIADKHPDAIFATIVAIMVMTSLGAAVSFILLGRFKLANLVRYIPYPVICGFLAGVGWLLFSGGAGVMSGMELNAANLASYFHPGVPLLWAPGLGYSLIMFFVLSRFPHYLTLPLLLVVGVILFYTTLLLTGSTMETAREAGLLVQRIPGGGLWPSVTLDEIGKIHWQHVFEVIPSAITVVLISLVSVLLNVSGVEVSTRSDIDMNKELQVNGFANAIAGLGGCSPGYSSISLSLLGAKTGVNSRWIGIFASAVLLSVALFGGGVLQFLPKLTMGSLVILMGLLVLKEQLVDSYSKLSKMDYALVLMIFFAIALFGFLEGVGIGVGLAMVLFVFRFSQVPVVNNILRGNEVSGSSGRAIPEQRLLHMAGHRLLLYELSGFIFFGSANSITDQVTKHIHEDENPPDFVALDFSRMYGFDISAISNFIRLAQKLQALNIKLLLSGVPEDFIRLIANNADTATLEDVHCFDTRHEALEWYEQRILAQETQELTDSSKTVINKKRDDLFEQASEDYLAHLSAMEAFENLAHSLPDTITEKTIEAHTPLVQRGALTPGLYVIHFGEVCEIDEEEQKCGMGSGDVIGAWLLQQHSLAPYTYVTQKKTMAYYISADALKKLEKTAPEQALHLYKQLLALSGKSLNHSDPEQ